jgi:hypothetical protein
MGAGRLVVAGAVAATFLSLGCEDSKVPKAAVHNSLDQCIVESAWYDDAEDQPYGRAYGWVDAVGKDGQTVAREVVEGTGYAFAVLAPGSDCYAAAKQPGGTLWKTKAKQPMQVGQTTIILFSTDTAEPVDTSQPDICRFCRLGCCENSIKLDAATPPVDAGADVEPDVAPDVEPDVGPDVVEDVVDAADETADDASDAAAE